ncbi:unnamed protein product [Ambrosiozyma monospora]|uniref:Unnamed protein product n=1 Tax=Ambrosiozyma monospora TaxID=43982 RepID=A0ACB5TZP4_AMBMO|nr:unnamed protein product [Ambrosiozyma monospora]
MIRLNSLTKLIFLSILIAVGFLNIVLSCALFNNWLPLNVVAIFLIAPLPNSLLHSLQSSYETDFFSDGGDQPPIADFLQFLTGFLVISGSCLPVVFYHCGLINHWSLALSLTGGFLIYLSIVLFGISFKEDDSDGYDF